MREQRLQIDEVAHFAPPHERAELIGRDLTLTVDDDVAEAHLDSIDLRRSIDDEVDELNRQTIDALQNLVMNNSADIEPAWHYFSASRHVERIADHATNIAEDVIYLVDGEIARHRHEDLSFDRMG